MACSLSHLLESLLKQHLLPASYPDHGAGGSSSPLLLPYLKIYHLILVIRLFILDCLFFFSILAPKHRKNVSHSRMYSERLEKCLTQSGVLNTYGRVCAAREEERCVLAAVPQEPGARRAHVGRLRLTRLTK